MIGSHVTPTKTIALAQVKQVKQVNKLNKLNKLNMLTIITGGHHAARLAAMSHPQRQ
jgi:hypothetical protein